MSLSIEIVNGISSIKEGDTETTVEMRLIQGRGTAYDVSGKDVTIIVANKNGKLLEKPAIIGDKTGEVYFQVDVGEITGQGQMRLEVHVDEGGRTRVFPSKDYVILNVDANLNIVGQTVTSTTLNQLKDSLAVELGIDIDNYNSQFEQAVNSVTVDLREEIIDSAKLVWLPPVASFSNLSTTYTSAIEGNTSMVRDTGKVYRFNGAEWIEIQAVDATAINNAETRLAVTDQPDFVNDVRKIASAKQKMNVQIAVGNLKQFFVNVQSSPTKGVAYAFRKDAQDDYITLMEGATGDLVPITAIVDAKNNETESGTFVKTNAPNYYTTTVNDWIAMTFTGTKVTLNHYANNQGGMYEAILNEGKADEQRVNVSLYSATVVAVKESLIFQNLEKKKHTLKLVFKGQDPANPIASPRGWYYYGATRPQDVKRTFNIYDDTFNITQTAQALYNYSNKEFAISARPAGSTVAYQFVPEHNAIGTAFNLQDTQLLVDGKAVSWDTGNYYVDVETVQLIQKVKGVHTSDTANPLMEIITYHTIKNGVVQISGRVKFLRDTQIDVGYALMLPYFTSFAKKIKTSIGNSYDVITNNPNYKEYWPEGSQTQSFAVLNNVDAGDKMNTVLSMTIDNFKRTNRLGKVGFGNPFSWIEHRSSSIGKIYFQQFQNTTVSTGEEFRFDGRISVSYLPNSSDFIL